MMGLVAAMVVLTSNQAKADIDRAEQLADQAVRANPSLAGIKAKRDALKHRLRRASSWHDPQLAIEYSNMPIDSWRPGDHPMSGLQLKLQQTFLFPGKTAARRQQAEGQLAEAQISLAEATLQLRVAVKRAYYQLTLVRQLRKVTEQHVKLVEQFVSIVQAKYTVGAKGQQDLLRLTLLLEKLKDDLEDFDRDDLALRAKINAALDREPPLAIETPAQLAALAAPREPRALTRSLGDRPAVRLHRQRALTHAAMSRRAARAGYPDLTAWLGYRIRSRAGTDRGTDFISLGIALPLPIFYARRFGSEVQAQRLLASKAQHQRRALIAQIRANVAAEVAAWRRAQRAAKRYRTVLMPLAHRALDATLAGFQVGRVDFASLFQAELELLAFERTIRRAEIRTHRARVEIEAQLGRLPQ
ncbi:MAG: TolC family protein [Deltaproteobacteria bacterium]|nr:TolC family protein [Deltaproteobacteria bacterium]